MERTLPRPSQTVRTDPAHEAWPATRLSCQPAEPTYLEPSAKSLGGAVYEVVWSAAALQVVVLMGHLIGVVLFAVDDLAAALRSLGGFSLFIWGSAGLYLIPTIVTHYTPAPSGQGPWTDYFLDAPWFDGGKPEP